MKITFGTYNLEYGGIDNGDDSRFHRQLAMLADLNADVWALQECSWWRNKENGRLALAEHVLGMTGAVARSARHPGGDLAVLVRETAGLTVTGTRHEEQPPYWHGVAVVHAKAAGFGPVRFASTHLSPAAPDQRAIEAQAFALIAEKEQLGPLIAGGDWNAVPVSGAISGTEGVHPGKLRRKLDRRAAEALAEYMTDMGAFVKDTTPTVGHRRFGKLAYPCDRIYVTLGHESISGFKVIHEPEPESDHRPVVGQFTLRS